MPYFMWRGWISASKLELFRATVFLPAIAILSIIGGVFIGAVLATVLGAILGILAGAHYGGLDGRQIANELETSETVSRSWKDPSPIQFLLEITPIIAACSVVLASNAGAVTLSNLTDFLVGSVAFIGWMMAVVAIRRWRAFKRFETASGRRIKAMRTFAGSKYKTE